MWRPATFALESTVSWFVNRVLIGKVQGQADADALLAFIDSISENDPLSFFDTSQEPALSPHVVWKHSAKHPDRAEFSFSSDVPLGLPQNDTAQGRVLFHPNRQHGHAMILLHGWITPGHQQSFMIARELQRYGFSTFMLELPFHMRRTPKGSFSGTGIIQPDLRVFFRALRQAIADIHKLIKALRMQGYQCIHLCGISLGAFLSAITASLPHTAHELASLSLCMPLVDLHYTFQHSPIMTAGRRILSQHALDEHKIHNLFKQFRLTQFKPRLSPEQILLINARHDQVTYSHKVHELWEAWDRPTMFEEPHGHVSMFFAKEPYEKMARYLGQRTAQYRLSNTDTTLIHAK
jgi:esterase/lipase